MLGKIEGGRRRGQQRMRWLYGITDSMDMSLSWWWTRKPGVLQLQRVRQDWATELSWEPHPPFHSCTDYTLSSVAHSQDDIMGLSWRNVIRFWLTWFHIVVPLSDLFFLFIPPTTFSTFLIPLISNHFLSHVYQASIVVLRSSGTIIHPLQVPWLLRW